MSGPSGLALVSVFPNGYFYARHQTPEHRRGSRPYGAEFLRLSRFHTGAWAGEWLISTRYSSWEVYGKMQEAVAKDPAFAKLMAHTVTFAELKGRNISVGIDL